MPLKTEYFPQQVIRFSMMNWIFIIMICSGLTLGMINGNTAELLNALTDGADGSIKLIMTIGGSYMLWMGLVNIADRAGLTQKLAHCMEKPLKLLMPNVGAAAAPITLNLSANFLGLANAATPFGIEAMKQLSIQNGGKSKASKDICMFLALNASAIELLPTSVIAVRTSAGSSNAYSIVLPTLISSVVACAAAVAACKLFENTLE